MLYEINEVNVRFMVQIWLITMYPKIPTEQHPINSSEQRSRALPWQWMWVGGAGEYGRGLAQWEKSKGNQGRPPA